VGQMAILYREHPDPEKRKIAVPATGERDPEGVEERE